MYGLAAGWSQFQSSAAFHLGFMSGQTGWRLSETRKHLCGNSSAFNSLGGKNLLPGVCMVVWFMYCTQRIACVKLQRADMYPYGFAFICYYLKIQDVGTYHTLSGGLLNHQESSDNCEPQLCVVLSGEDRGALPKPSAMRSSSWLRPWSKITWTVMHLLGRPLMICWSSSRDGLLSCLQLAESLGVVTLDQLFASTQRWSTLLVRHKGMRFTWFRMESVCFSTGRGMGGTSTGQCTVSLREGRATRSQTCGSQTKPEVTAHANCLCGVRCFTTLGQEVAIY